MQNSFFYLLFLGGIRQGAEYKKAIASKIEVCYQLPPNYYDCLKDS
ncbi:hypothetical protein Cylst_3680 [Cylindrospermum stagnale PCC 7417]|uniref:Uncharacterized protein n=1 Tax=Cylindrospermum stagnale PCC 7417 TaxID=56107 RepID=K9X162_9NOST|nr:hypothetical protein Cylst_3680 [Cylindrospermum stagnale PCC 7417]